MKRNGSALDIATDLLRKTATRIAVVGASNDPTKFGNIIVNDLLRHGYDVIPVNLHETTIAGLPVFQSLGEVPKPVDIVDVVTPPPATHRVLEEAAEAGVKLIWLQDGSFDDDVLAAAEAFPFDTVHDACIMVVARRVHSPAQ